VSRVRSEYGRLANLAASDKDELWDRVVEELDEAKSRPDLLQGFIRKTGLPASRWPFEWGPWR